MKTGIDISKSQYNVDFNLLLADQQVNFIIMRAGYRGYGAAGTLVQDAYIDQYAVGAASIPHGLYFFSQAINEDEAREEAEFAIRIAQTYKLDCPMGIWFDSEMGNNGSGRADNLSVPQRSACADAFCRTCEQHGYKTGIYASTSWFGSHLNPGKWNLWVADYRGYMGYQGANHVSGWQYTSSGSVNGISTRVDMNEWYDSIEPVQPALSDEPAFIKCYASAGDARAILTYGETIGVQFYESDDGALATIEKLDAGAQSALISFTLPLGIKWEINKESVTNEPTRLFTVATGMDKYNICNLLKELGIVWMTYNSEIVTTSLIAPEDQTALIAFGAYLGIKWNVYEEPVLNRFDQEAKERIEKALKDYEAMQQYYKSR